MTDQDDKIESNDEIANPAPATLSRRAMLRGTAAAMPVVLTLQSGAALARSSNLIGVASPDTVDIYDRTLCVELNSAVPADGTGMVYDFGPTPDIRVTAIHNNRYYSEQNRGSLELSRANLCDNDNGGYAYYKPATGGSWQEVYVRKGIIVSAVALSSFAAIANVIDAG